MTTEPSNLAYMWEVVAAARAEENIYRAKYNLGPIPTRTTEVSQQLLRRSLYLCLDRASAQKFFEGYVEYCFDPTIDTLTTIEQCRKRIGFELRDKEEAIRTLWAEAVGAFDPLAEQEANRG